MEEFSLPTTPERIAKQVSDMVAEEYRELLPLKPHAMELLDWLDGQNIVYGVATATYGELAAAALKRLGVWERLQFLITEQDAGASKSQPQIFQQAAQKLHLGRRQIAVAEDSLYALQTAKRAGFFTVGVYDNASQPVWPEICATATVHVQDLLEMKPVLRGV